MRGKLDNEGMSHRRQSKGAILEHDSYDRWCMEVGKVIMGRSRAFKGPSKQVAKPKQSCGNGVNISCPEKKRLAELIKG